MSVGKTQQRSTSEGQSYVDPNQVPFLGRLRTNAENVASSQMGSIGDFASALSGRLGGVGGNMLSALDQFVGTLAPGAAQSIAGSLGIGGSATAGAIRGIGQGSLAGTDALSGLAAGSPGSSLDFQELLGPSPALSGSISALDEFMQRNLESTLRTQAGQATLAGQTGGAIQADLAGRASEESIRAFERGANELVGEDFARRSALAPMIAGMEMTGRGIQLGAANALNQGELAQGGLLSGLLGTELQGLIGGGSLGVDAQGMQIGAAQSGIGALSNLYNLGMSPFAAEFSPLLNLAGIIGAPTVLSRQQSRSRGDSLSLGYPIGGGGSG